MWAVSGLAGRMRVLWWSRSQGQYVESAYVAAKWAFHQVEVCQSKAKIRLVVAQYATGTVCLLQKGPGEVIYSEKWISYFQACTRLCRKMQSDCFSQC